MARTHGEDILADLQSARRYQSELIEQIYRHSAAYLAAIGVSTDDLRHLRKLTAVKPRTIRVGNKVFALSVDYLPSSMDIETGEEGEWEFVLSACCSSHPKINHVGNELGGGCYIDNTWHSRLIHAIMEDSEEDTGKRGIAIKRPPYCMASLVLPDPHELDHK